MIGDLVCTSTPFESNFFINSKPMLAIFAAPTIKKVCFSNDMTATQDVYSAQFLLKKLIKRSVSYISAQMIIFELGN